ncbi:hypothetical protein VO56_02275 [Mycoplasmopsis gallinacea]|uniref:Uncharacterized protein n=1 Tax=Mycoplasmopsis gallinacea TaxID=29556 RepID=A0A0D5ZK89_9BACT|nr:hypothetical protein VO56_02275 [Mycoplasmopsis gallinacea]
MEITRYFEAAAEQASQNPSWFQENKLMIVAAIITSILVFTIGFAYLIFKKVFTNNQKFKSFIFKKEIKKVKSKLEKLSKTKQKVYKEKLEEIEKENNLKELLNLKEELKTVLKETKK